MSELSGTSVFSSCRDVWQIALSRRGVSTGFQSAQRNRWLTGRWLRLSNGDSFQRGIVLRWFVSPRASSRVVTARTLMGDPGCFVNNAWRSGSPIIWLKSGVTWSKLWTISTCGWTCGFP